MDKKKILFVSHKKTKCGVYEFGKKVLDVLEHSQQFKFIGVECSSLVELKSAISQFDPAAIIFNYYPPVMPWVSSKITKGIYKNNIASKNIPKIGIVHEVTKQVADQATNYQNKILFGKSQKLFNSLFDFYIAPDPTLLLQNPYVFKTGRLIQKYKSLEHSSETIIGSFGFGTDGKGFEKIVELVNQEFDKATIRLNISLADFGDADGQKARLIAEKCKANITKPGINLIITHEYMDDKELLDFLSQNTINVFLYETKGNRGISSTIDYAMAVKKPIAISNSIMFRHLFDVTPSICVSKNNLKTIIENGFSPLQKHYDEWTEENLLWEYERIVSAVLGRYKKLTMPKMGIKRTVISKINRLFSLPDKTFTWLRNSDKPHEDNLTVDRTINYSPIKIPKGISLNRILDNSARKLYQPTIDKLIELVPATMAKKIAEANVQQAFIFDTVFRYLSDYQSPKLLCVGSYEDTASMSLLKMGYNVEEIDPMLNYYLQEYVSKPSTKIGTYNIIFSTSVIEHDPDDKSFIQCIEKLLAPGGVAIITCDYKEKWKLGELKPDADERLYTKKDLEGRLLSYMPSCNLVDEPQWECENPDFIFLGRYNYTFATFVVRKDI